MNCVTWGLDGYGIKHYFCKKCRESLGMDADNANTHKCKTQKRRSEK